MFLLIFKEQAHSIPIQDKHKTEALPLVSPKSPKVMPYIKEAKKSKTRKYLSGLNHFCILSTHCSSRYYDT
jgi:hypothetical protein